jgi:3-oxoacyl-[acyl-carrier protein] reductase
MTAGEEAARRRWALITGSGRGLGKAVATHLAQGGWGVVVNARQGRSFAAAVDLVAQIRRAGGQAELAEGDAATFEGGRRVAEGALSLAGQVDAAVLGVGPWDHDPLPVSAVTEADLARILRGNVEGALGTLSVLLPAMRARRFGRVITFGMDHVEAAPGWAGHGLYAAAKAALLSLTRTVAWEEAAFGVTAHMIAPGNIRGPFKEATIAEARAAAADRPGTGEDIARVIRFLLSEDSDFLTGGVIPVGGGEVVWRPGAAGVR